MGRNLNSDLPNIRVRLEPDEYETLVALARLNDRSIAAEVRVAVRKHLTTFYDERVKA